MKRAFIATLLAWALLAPTSLQADSIWGRRHFLKAFLFVDTRPRRIGDLVTIVVTENTDITNSDKRDLSKEKKHGLGFSLKGSVTGTTASQNSASGLDITHNMTKEYIGQSAFSSDQHFLDRMTATVIDVLPNGNLIIEGCRDRIVGDEVRSLHVTGMIRPIDIGTANTIDSGYISNLHMYYSGKGPQSNYSNQGWFSRKFYHLWPF